MRDDLMGGALATAVAAPAVIVCCGGGGVLLAGLTGAVGGWLSGLGGIAALVVAAGAALTWRSLRRRTGDDACCIDAADANETVHGQS
ncbi:hypothetical protein VQ042_13005 [Aurantimonas sp. A2-1-M11]|uniref:hypothetical protein n=1 Tax=Aurantimonas sp. A2-1-M11 TaxID=3113712 RepID=UPI002F94C7F7